MEKKFPGEPPLFRTYPLLAGKLPHVPLGMFPTAVEKLAQLGEEIGLDNLFIKRDDLSGAVYGGNKVRKLEFLLGAALRDNAREVITFGFAGSNHALATAIYAGQLGLKCTSMLLPQVNARYVRRNLLAGHHYKADLRHYGNSALMGAGLLLQLLRGKMRDGVLPVIIPAGGSSPLGVLGYVNALLELKGQIVAGALPEPDLIYLPLGSMGTAVGLMVGIRIAGLKSRVVPVRVIEEKMAGPRKMLRLLHDTAALLHGMDPAVPEMEFSEKDLNIRDDCLGGGYARFTERGNRAAELLRRKAGITLNGTYSAKAFSALMDDAGKGLLGGKTVLFWNTYNSRGLSRITSGVDFHRLPMGFHRYFENDVQLLDRDGSDP